MIKRKKNAKRHGRKEKKNQEKAVNYGNLKQKMRVTVNETGCSVDFFAD